MHAGRSVARGSAALFFASLALSLAPRAAHAQEHPPPVMTQPLSGRVIEVEDRFLVIDRGGSDGVFFGAAIEIATEDGSVIVRTQFVEPTQSRVPRPFGVNVAVGTAVRMTTAQRTVTNAGPVRPSYVGMEARLFGAVSANGNSGGAVFAELLGRYRARVPLAISARVSPLGVGFGESGAYPIFHWEAGLSLDLRFFEIGATLGASITDIFRPTLGTTTGVFVRVGARDGVFGELGMSYAYVDGRFEWAYARFDASIPLRFGTWLVFHTSGGRTRHGMGSVGLRVMLRGSGGPGSLFFSVHFGGAGALDPSGGFSRVYAGPMLGAGIERRF